MLAAAVLGLAAGNAAADYIKITERDQFARLIAENRLTRMGIDLRVTPGGRIEGRAFGRPVTGSWDWQDGYFCRDLYWGETEIGYNCQEVARDGDALRFTSDRGSGDSARLWLE